jgi:predicted RNA binding protein YcfA (HicA-like mRNA interferase family)
MNAARLPVVDGRRVAKALRQAGFVVDRIVGSHHIMTVPGNPARTVTVPVHGSKDLKPGTLRSIIRQAGFTPEEFSNLL